MHKAKPVYFYIYVGMVIGWVSALLSFIYVGGADALWALAVFGCVCMFLGCIYFYKKANNLPQKSSESKKLFSSKSKV